MEQSQHLRILQVVQGFPPEFIGGTELYCRALTTTLHDRGHSCFVLAGSYAPAQAPAFVTTNDEGFPVARYVSPLPPIWREHQHDPYNPEAENVIRHYLQLVQPEVIHLHHWMRLTTNIVSIAAELDLPTVVTLHDMWTSCARLHRQHKEGHFCQEPPTPALCARCVERPQWQSEEEVQQALALRHQQIDEELRLAQCLIVPSDSHRQQLSRLLDIDVDRFRVVPNGAISHLQPQAAQRSAPFPARPLRLAYWGYLVDFKGVHLILEAARRLAHPASVEVYLAGLAPEPHYLDTLTKQAEGLAVTFVGEYRPDDLAQLDVDLVVLPSLAAESYGFVLDEAFQLGLPVIVSDRGALASRAGEAGLVFPAESAEGLARRIQEILDTPLVLETLRQHIPALPSPPMQEHVQTLEKIYEEVHHRSVEGRDTRPAVPAGRRLQHLQHQLLTREQDIHTLTVDLQQHRDVLADHKALVAQHRETVHQQDEALQELRTQRAQQSKALQQKEKALQTRQPELPKQHRGTVHLERQLQEEGQRTQALTDALHRIYGSRGWRLLARFYFVRERFVAPPGTRRGRLYDRLKKVGAVYATGGWRGVWAAIRRSFQKDPTRPGVVDSGGGDPYRAWLAAHVLTQEQLQQQREEVADLSFQPTISIVMPVYNTDETWLRRAVASVRNQVYPRWELCVCDDGSSQARVGELLTEFAQDDPRIHINTNERNMGIAGASNQALALATGEFVGLLDHDDELSPDALFEVVRYLNAHPDTDLVYSDEDKIDPQGQRMQPFFKPDWSPDMLLSFMYTCHFSVYRRECLLEVGGFDPDCNGSQDYDLALKVTERTQAIGHIPKILYHWRIVPGSIAEQAMNKLYAYEAGKRALTAALERRGISGSVEDTFGLKEGLGFYRVRRSCDTSQLVSIIIPTRDRLDLLSRCIASIETYTTYPTYEIVIVDNDSVEQQTLDYFQHTPHRVIQFGGDFHFSRMMNAAVEQVSGNLILFLNNDIEVLSAEWLNALVEQACRPEVGAVGTKLLYPNHAVQHAGVIIGLCEFAGHSHRHVSGFQHGYWGSIDIIRNYSAVTAACLMMRRSLFLEMDGFDEAFQYAYQDVDLCLRLRDKGLLSVYTPYAPLVHYESASRGGAMAFGGQDIALARSRWHTYLSQGDPYYNPNLTHDSEDFSIAVGPSGRV